MKYLLLLTLLISGCTLSVKQDVIMEATNLCLPHSGVKEVWVGRSWREQKYTYVCNDEKIIEVTEELL